MVDVVVVMSTYNGEHVIEKQLDSIFAQRGVCVKCLIRDDGSSDRTVDIIQEYAAKRKVDIKLVIGKNVGWRRSFILALIEAPQADYYAFSDQDDIWFEDKLLTGVTALKCEKEKILLYHCNRICVNEKLEVLKLSTKKMPRPLSRINSLCQEYVQGCSLIINYNAKELICRHIPSDNIPHDFWCGLICYWFGKIIYDEIPYFYYVKYKYSNVTDTGNLIKTRLERLKRLNYINPINDLLEGYGEELEIEDINMLNKFALYKDKMRYKISILFSKDFRRNSFIGTIGVKLAVLLNKF